MSESFLSSGVAIHYNTAVQVYQLDLTDQEKSPRVEQKNTVAFFSFSFLNGAMPGACALPLHDIIASPCFSLHHLYKHLILSVLSREVIYTHAGLCNLSLFKKKKKIVLSCEIHSDLHCHTEQNCGWKKGGKHTRMCNKLHHTAAASD